MKAIVLAGGSGTRLWPLSRTAYPKQFLRVNGEFSLLQQAVQRLLKLVSPEDILIITNSSYKFHVRTDIEGLSPVLPASMLLEPTAKNTAPAVALGVKYCMERMKCDPGEIIFVCPSDHIINPVDPFLETLRKAEEIAHEGYIVTFGVVPDSPETGYGYIRKGKDLGGFFRAEHFAEKPNAATVLQYLSDGRYLWNSGMFAFSIGTIIDAFRQHAPDIGRMFGDATARGPVPTFDDAIRTFDQMPSISIDYAVMEKSERVVTIPLSAQWSDVGSWDSMYDILQKDENGNAAKGDVLALATRNSLIIAENRLIVTAGLDDLLVVETDDAILITRRGDSQRVREIVDLLKEKNRPEADEHATTYRPWGRYTVLEEGHRHKIKRVVVKPGAKLSLQYHHHRSEHWVVVRGSARVTIGEMVTFVHENESAYVPKSTPHRLENPGKVPLEIIEVQNGEYVGEDDISRLEDLYGRKEESRGERI